MVLVDTSVWIQHLRKGHPLLKKLLEDGEVLTCPFVIGEIAMGSIGNRAEILALLRTLPQCRQASHDEVMHFVETNGLAGTGIGYIDAHLLASGRLFGVPIFTLDGNLKSAARRLAMNYL
jgi:predicted nucleic acid-binding protein